MRNININFITILFICFALFFFPDNVFAAESLGTCVYELDRTGLEESLSIGDFDKLSLSITVNDDGTIGANTISTVSGGDTWSSNTRDAYLIDESHSRLKLMYMISDEDFYNAYMEKNNCPTIEMANQQGEYLEVKLGSNNYSEGTWHKTFENVQAQGGTSGSKPSEIITYCKEKPFKVLGYDEELYFTTTETNGVKEYSLETSDGKSFATTFDQILTLDTFRFYVNPNSYNLYWSDKCQDTPLYVAVPDNTSTTRVIQHTQDSTVENYEPPLLNGGATDGNWDQPIGCEDIFNISEEGSVGWVLMTLLNYVRVIGPIAVVLLSALDFIKAIMSSDEKAMKQAQSKLVIRLIAALALFLIPTLVSLLLDLINTTNCANNL